MPGKTRLHDVQQDEEHPTLGHEAYAASIWVRDVTAVLMESYSAVTRDQVSDAEYWGVNICVLNSELKQ